MEPIRKVQSATHFKFVNDTQLTPCSPGAQDAIEMTWVDIESNQLLEPDLTLKDFIKAVKRSKPTINKKDLEQQIKFTNDFGN
jgi:vacuolar protein-sorting-associated protein 4